MKKLQALTLVLLILVAVTSCAPAGPPPGTVAASQVQLRHVSAFLKPGFTLDHAYVVRSQAHQNASFFAARIAGVRPEPAVGVWLLSGSSDSPGLTLSVNAYAKEFSVAPDGAKSQAEVSMADPPASDLQRFVESQLR
jgi:hypothetical protein